MEQLELFFTAFDFYATMDSTQFPKADEDMTSSPFDDKGYLYYNDMDSKDWVLCHEEV
jgi:hypothetical protein|tara:strand:+ start:170 stop:343 length:174 start_codon:yes stop_codon:yes gene_type:complete